MHMTNWVKMLNGDNSGLKKEEKVESIITDDKKYRIQFANGQKTTLVDHDQAVYRVNEWMNRQGWDWIKVTNENTKKTQVVKEPTSPDNRGFLHLRKLNENMLRE